MEIWKLTNYSSYKVYHREASWRNMSSSDRLNIWSNNGSSEKCANKRNSILWKSCKLKKVLTIIKEIENICHVFWRFHRLIETRMDVRKFWRINNGDVNTRTRPKGECFHDYFELFQSSRTCTNASTGLWERGKRFIVLLQNNPWKIGVRNTASVLKSSKC